MIVGDPSSPPSHLQDLSNVLGAIFPLSKDENRQHHDFTNDNDHNHNRYLSCDILFLIMPQTAVGTGTAARSAPYGQACLACFKTKCKCVPRVGGTGCERCHRLKRPCNSADALRRRGDKNKNSNSSDARIQKLEGTLGHLVSLLQAGSPVQVNDLTNTWQQQQQQSPQQQHQQQPQPQPQPSPDGDITRQQHSSTLTPISLASVSQEDRSAEEADGPTNIDDNSGEQDEDGGIDVDDDVVGALQWDMAIDSLGGDWQTVPHASPQPSSAVSGATVPDISISPTMASACLDTFRSRKLPYFPFVHLPDYVTTQQLQRERPFLLRAIVCVTSSTHDKRTRALELKRTLCEALFLQESPNQLQQALDLLLGLLTYVAWGWDHVISRGSLSRLMAVAVSLAGEILLDKAAPEPTRTMRLLEPKGFERWSGGINTGVEASNDHLYLECRRAGLGCFVLASAVSAHFSEIDAPRWTMQMEEGLAAINSSGSGVECPSDACLASQVRLQLIAMRATQVREQCQLPGQPPAVILPAPSLLYIKTLMGQVQDVRVSIPPAFQQHFALLAQTYYTELCIIENIHSKEELTSISNPAPSLPTCGPTRLSCFWQAALAIKSCTSTLLTLSPSDLRGVSFIQWTQLARCIATLHHLSVLSEPGWDLAAVRSLVDLPALLASAAEKLEQASAEVGDEAPDSVFNQLACGLRKFQLTREDQNHGKGTGPLLAQQEGARVGTGADAEARAYGQPQGYFLSPTLWLDQLFVDYDGQEIAAL